ncbi:protein of unknown function DUF633 [Thermosinus carboxydivorans Nor1]|uniref:SAM-dependent methyltransferase n=1 Tax=Thermosinus carboxydivorans Nor1 TaxID=401526 RepID=A1HPB2_9FIRM|nr:class I SAM-dependent methyltransferase [Thermosinus carboxydivorans]EAX48218.1 protein of unknown function DUF633 [Thermosinus carboxydivorans Nor1]
MRLGARLAAIAKLVPSGTRLADIGTDHAMLPVCLVREGVISYAVAGEVHKGPFETAQAAVTRLGLENFITVRFGNGLEVLRPYEVETVVIAGMGGATIIEILSQRPEVTQTLKLLLLQPMVGAAAVRRWLKENGWRLSAEDLVEEEGRLYEIIAAVQGSSPEYEDILYDIGPLLWESRHRLLKQHIAHLIEQITAALMAMAESPQAKSSVKYRDLTRKLAQLEAKRKWLSSVTLS